MLQRSEKHQGREADFRYGCEPSGVEIGKQSFDCSVHLNIPSMDRTGMVLLSCVYGALQPKICHGILSGNTKAVQVATIFSISDVPLLAAITRVRSSPSKNDASSAAVKISNPNRK